MKNFRLPSAAIGLVLLFAPAASGQSGPQVPTGDTPTTANTAPDDTLEGFGRPVASLTTAQLADFLEGQSEFKETEDITSGLGPIFNNVSCVACHARPSVGGSSNITVIRYGLSTNGTFDPLTALGGTLLHEFSAIPQLRETIPAAANVIIARQTTPLYGLGLIEAIEDTTILANAKKNQSPALAGKISWVTDLAASGIQRGDVVLNRLRVGRFGWKAQHATLLDFAADAYNNEMGITNRLFPHENAPNGNTALLLQYVPDHPLDDTFDPVTNNSGIDKLANYMRMLAPPPRAPVLTPGVANGQRLFTMLQCACCYTPSLTTGPSAVKSLDHQAVALYSDLLLHDMGALGDGIVQGMAGATEMRTAPLWGLRGSGPYLHDGRAGTVDDAIRQHDGQARVARDRYVASSPANQDDLIAFLLSL